MLLAVWLFRGALLQEAFLVQLQEDLVDDLGLFRGGRAAKVVETNVEPVIDLLVLDVELVAELLRGDASLEGSGLGGSTVLHAHKEQEKLATRSRV